MSQSLVAEDEDVRQSCFTKSAEEPGGHGGVWLPQPPTRDNAAPNLMASR
jgi:hypothetical protein